MDIKTFFHVTDASRIPSILKRGLEPTGHERNYPVLSKERVYAWMHPLAATDWANTEPGLAWLVTFLSNPKTWQRDTNLMDTAEYFGARARRGPVSPHDIVSAIPWDAAASGLVHILAPKGKTSMSAEMFWKQLLSGLRKLQKGGPWAG